MIQYFLSILFICAGFLTIATCVKKTEVHFPPEKLGMIFEVTAKCIAETGVQPDIVFQLSKNSQELKNKDEKEKKDIHKFLACSFQKSGYSKKNGHVKTDKIIAELFPDVTDKETLRRVFQECDNNNGTSPIEILTKFLVCFKEKSPVKVVL
uniref:Odorant-binding protein 12 n=1 Tax=Heortia vitessoides TaxID=1557813 RepID=A0A978W7A5_9NEOP|nr:odorant-binding protein 12 [Heortia vitessoides]